jgi:hypothetical protein
MILDLLNNREIGDAGPVVLAGGWAMAAVDWVGIVGVGMRGRWGGCGLSGLKLRGSCRSGMR